MSKIDKKEKQSKYNKIKILIISISTLTAGLVAFLSNLDFINNKFNEWFGDGSARIYYTRLYGAYQVPALMFKNDYFKENTRVSIINYSEPLSEWETTRFKDTIFRLGPVGEDLRQAFKSYINDSSSLSDPITQLVFPPGSLIRLKFQYLDRWMFNLSEEDVKRVESTIKNHDPEDYDKTVFQITQQVERTTNDIGYLFLTIENVSSKSELENITMEYEIFNINPLGSSCITTQDRLTPKGLPIESNLELNILRIRRNEITMLPIAVYRADAKDYPKEFCSSVIVPSKLNWLEDGNRKSIKINLPLLDKAAKVNLPFGWSFQ